MEDSFKKTGLEQTVVELLEAHSNNGVNQTNMLLMLSLVNIMGVVDILKRSTVGDKASNELQRGEMSEPANTVNPNADLMNLVHQAASGQLDPVQLIGMLNQPGGQMPNPASLMGLLSQIMPPPPPQSPPHNIKQPPPQYNQHNSQSVREDLPIRETMDQEYKQDLELETKENEIPTTTSSNKSYLKWDPRLG